MRVVLRWLRGAVEAEHQNVGEIEARPVESRRIVVGGRRGASAGGKISPK